MLVSGDNVSRVLRMCGLLDGMSPGFKDGGFSGDNVSRVLRMFGLLDGKSPGF